MSNFHPKMRYYVRTDRRIIRRKKPKNARESSWSACKKPHRASLTSD